MFLTPAELAELTGRTRPSAQDTSDDPRRPWLAAGQAPIEWFEQNFRAFVFAPNHIVTSSQPYEPGRGDWAPGIYFIIENSRIVYVGKSVNIARRLDSHYVGPKRFTHFWCFTMPELFLTHVESYYTNLLRPLYNIDIGSPGEFIRQQIAAALAEDSGACS